MLFGMIDRVQLDFVQVLVVWICSIVVSECGVLNQVETDGKGRTGQDPPSALNITSKLTATILS